MRLLKEINLVNFLIKNTQHLNKKANYLVFNNLGSKKYYSANVDKEEPVKFSTSKAKKWDAIDSFVHVSTRAQPKIQPYAVVISFMALIIYFGLIREENELDSFLSKSLEESVPNVKEMTLRHQIIRYDSLGLDTKELREALNAELKNNKAAKK